MHFPGMTSIGVRRNANTEPNADSILKPEYASSPYYAEFMMYQEYRRRSQRPDLTLQELSKYYTKKQEHYRAKYINLMNMNAFLKATNPPFRSAVSDAVWNLLVDNILLPKRPQPCAQFWKGTEDDPYAYHLALQIARFCDLKLKSSKNPPSIHGVGTAAGTPAQHLARNIARSVAHLTLQKTTESSSKNYSLERGRKVHDERLEPDHAAAIHVEKEQLITTWVKVGFEIWSAILGIVSSLITPNDSRQDELVDIIICLRDCQPPADAPEDFWSQLWGLQEAWNTAEWCAPLFPMLDQRKVNYTIPFVPIESTGSHMSSSSWSSLNSFLARLVAAIGNEKGLDHLYIKGFCAIVEALEVPRSVFGEIDALLPAAVHWIIHAKHILSSVNKSVMRITTEPSNFTVNAQFHRCANAAGKLFVEAFRALHPDPCEDCTKALDGSSKQPFMEPCDACDNSLGIAGMYPARWKFWEQRLEQLENDCRLSQDVQELSRIARLELRELALDQLVEHTFQTLETTPDQELDVIHACLKAMVVSKAQVRIEESKRTCRQKRCAPSVNLERNVHMHILRSFMANEQWRADGYECTWSNDDKHGR
jgi:hypothetical protein